VSFGSTDANGNCLISLFITKQENAVKLWKKKCYNEELGFKTVFLREPFFLHLKILTNLYLIPGHSSFVLLSYFFSQIL